MATTATAVPPTLKRATRTMTLGLERLPDKFLICRDVLHAWAVEADFHVETDYVEGGKSKAIPLVRVLVCMRCETKRKDHYLMGRYGLEKLGKTYDYPTGYQIPGTTREVAKGKLVLQEQFRRSSERAQEAMDRQGAKR